MADLTKEAVAALIRRLGLPADDDDVAEVTHRLNATIDAIAKIDHPGLDEAVPMPVAALEPKHG